MKFLSRADTRRNCRSRNNLRPSLSRGLCEYVSPVDSDLIFYSSEVNASVPRASVCSLLANRVAFRVPRSPLSPCQMHTHASGARSFSFIHTADGHSCPFIGERSALDISSYETSTSVDPYSVGLAVARDRSIAFRQRRSRSSRSSARALTDMEN